MDDRVLRERVARAKRSLEVSLRRDRDLELAVRQADRRMLMQTQTGEWCAYCNQGYGLFWVAQYPTYDLHLHLAFTPWS